MDRSIRNPLFKNINKTNLCNILHRQHKNENEMENVHNFNTLQEERKITTPSNAKSLTPHTQGII